MEVIFLEGNDEPVSSLVLHAYIERTNNGSDEIPDSGLINGIGRFVGGPQVIRARVNVEQGKRYRFRVVNISAYAAFRFSIEGHDLTIIEVRYCDLQTLS
jgi:iron transport multicopper oxidase